MEKLVSIIVPVYNAGKYIAETIESVLGQTWENWELLLVDDCSKDNSSQIIRQYGQLDRRIRFISKEKNEGPAMTRNEGMRHAQGRYIAFLDADDIWLPEKLDRELAFMEKKQAAFVFTAYVFGNERAQSTGKTVCVPECLDYRSALSRTVIFTSTVLFDTTLLTKSLIQMPDVKSEDTACWWKILKTGCVAYGLNEAMVIYRRPVNSLSSNKVEAVRRIWDLYRRQEGLSLLGSAGHLVMWAYRATKRRI